MDRLFYRHTHAYRGRLLDFSRRATNILALDQLSQDMVHLIVGALRAQWGALLGPDPVTGYFRIEYREPPLSPEEGAGELRLRQDNPLVAYLTQEGEVLRHDMIDVAPHGRGLWEQEREGLRHLQVNLLCPVLTRGTLAGIILLGPKEGGRPYTDEEADLLLAMSSGAAVAMENARIMERLRQREQAHEQLLSHVVSAQEEERQRIAAELHDSVAQWLIRASYQTQVAAALTPDGQGNGLHGELTDIETTIDSSIKELRRVLAGLRPPALEELGLPHALRREMENLSLAHISQISRVGAS